MTGRGRLYYWGPNHAGDPVVTRWLRDEKGSIVQRKVEDTGELKPVLEFVTIQRHDTKQWALPGVKFSIETYLNIFLKLFSKGYG